MKSEVNTVEQLTSLMVSKEFVCNTPTTGLFHKEVMTTFFNKRTTTFVKSLTNSIIENIKQNFELSTVMYKNYVRYNITKDSVHKIIRRGRNRRDELIRNQCNPIQIQLDDCTTIITKTEPNSVPYLSDIKLTIGC